MPLLFSICVSYFYCKITNRESQVIFVKEGKTLTPTEMNAALEARRAYQRNWRKNNPDKVKQHTMRYWQRVAERERAAAQEGQNDRKNQ